MRDSTGGVPAQGYRPLRYRRSYGIAEAGTLDIAALHLEHAYWKPIVTAQRDRSGIHDPQMILQELIISDVLKERGVCKPNGVPVVDSIDLRCFEKRPGSNLHGAESRRRVCGEIRITRPCSADYHVPPVQMPDRSPSDVRLGHLPDFYCRHDSGRHASSF